MFEKIFVGLFCIGTGYLFLRYAKTVLEWTGHFMWAERYLGRGGTVVVIYLMGAGLIFFGVGYPFGAFDDMNSGVRINE